jgi:hypothetical protein
MENCISTTILYRGEDNHGEPGNDKDTLLRIFRKMHSEVLAVVSLFKRLLLKLGKEFVIRFKSKE